MSNVINQKPMAAVRRVPLTDGSAVFNVDLFDILEKRVATVYALDEKAANALADLINQQAVVEGY